MGASSSLSPEEVDDICENTKFKKAELKRWYKKFIKDYPAGQLKKEQFFEVFSKLNKGVSNMSEEKAEHIFRMFDHNHDGEVSFKELMSTLSLTTRGSIRDKLEWVFDIYDVDGNGYITLEEISDVVKSMQDAKNGEMESGGNRYLSTTKVAAAFMAADNDNDGYLTVDEFIDAVEQLPELIQILNSAQ